MFSFEIAERLSNLQDFVGVFPRDRIPKIVSYPSFIVINTDQSSGPGTHWVAMRFTENECEYFDSFGLPPLHSEMVSAAQKRKLIWNGRCLQHPSSRTCGEFCVSFVKMRSRNVSFVKFVRIFNKDTKTNDKTVRNICSDQF